MESLISMKWIVYWILNDLVCEGLLPFFSLTCRVQGKEMLINTL